MYSKENKKTKPKVVIAMNDFLVGGIQKLAIDQMRVLHNEFDFVVIVLMQIPGNDWYHQIPAGIPIHKMHFKNFWDIRSWITLGKILRHEKPDIVKTAMFFSNTIFRILKPLFGYVVITAEHNTEAKRPWGQRVANFLLAPLAYTIIADSKTVAEFVSSTEYIPLNKFTVIYNGVELNEIAKAKSDAQSDHDRIRTELGVSADEPVFLTVARLVAQKNHALMIDGFAKYIKQGGKGKLVIIGYGQLEDSLRNQARDLGIGDQVKFMGGREDIYPFYVASDYFILTSVREGFCISAMNGLAFGLPLISTKVAGVVEYLEDGINGYFTDATPDAVAEVLIKVTNLPDDKLQIMKKSAEQTADRFGVQAYADAYRKLFTKCLRA